MKKKITLLLLLLSISIFSQEKLLFDELYELQDDKIKVYLDGAYKVMYKPCAKYYMICKINNRLEYTDAVHVYDLKDRIVVKSNFKESKLDGNFTSYFENGQISDIGAYSNGLQIGVWKSYYDNGQLKKVIDFGEGKYYPVLLEFYKKNGKQEVTDGNGEFNDLISTSVSSSRLIKYKGKAKMDYWMASGQ